MSHSINQVSFKNWHESDLKIKEYHNLTPLFQWLKHTANKLNTNNQRAFKNNKRMMMTDMRLPNRMNTVPQVNGQNHGK